MSKYYKAEDVINAIENKIAEYIPTLYGRYAEIPLELRMAIEHLPTIEVSEDAICQGRGDMFNDCQAVANASQEMYAKGYEDGRKSVEVSEDCISREYILGEAFASDEYNRETKSFDLPVVSVRDIEDAPSVVPTTDENKCHRHGIRLEDGTSIYECIGCDKQDCEMR